MTGHDEFEEDLPVYAAGRLEGEARRRLEAHLVACERCAEISTELKDLTQAIREAGRSLRDPHPSSEEIRALVRGETVTDRARIESHVRDCATCEIEVGAWQRILTQEATSIRPAQARGGVARRSLAGLAAALVAGVFLGAGLVDFVRPRAEGRRLLEPIPPAPAQPTPPQVTRHPEASIRPTPLYHLPAPLRGAGPAPVLRIDPDAELLTLEITPVIPPSIGDGEVIRIEIDDTAGRQLWVSRIEARALRRTIAESEAMAITLPLADLPDGALDLRLVAERPSGDSLVSRIPFEVERLR